MKSAKREKGKKLKMAAAAAPTAARPQSEVAEDVLRRGRASEDGQ